MKLYFNLKYAIFLAILFSGSSEALYGQCTDPSVGDLNAKNLAYSPSNLFACSKVTVTAEWDVESQWPYDADFHFSTLIVSLPSEFVGTSAENYTVTASDGMIYWDVSSITLTNDEFQVGLQGQIPSGTNISIVINKMDIDLGGAFFVSFNISQSISLIVADCVPTNDEQSISGNIFSGTGPSIVSMITNCSSTELVIDLSANPGATPFGPSTIVSYAWTGPNGFTSNTEDVSFTVNEGDEDLYKGEYTVIVTDNTGCETSSSITINEVNCAALPVEFIHFTAERRGTAALLSWQTSTEIDNDFFEVQRSIDGKTFEVIGKVKGSGNSSTIRNYTFDDRNPELGINFYRLRQVDYNGQFDYTPIRSVNFDSKDRLEVNYFPNPVMDELSIKSSKALENHRLEIFDFTGKLIKTQEFVSNSKISVEAFKSGVYFFRLKNNEGFVISTDKVIKIQ